MVWHKKFGLAQTIFEPVEGQVISNNNNKYTSEFKIMLHNLGRGRGTEFDIICNDKNCNLTFSSKGCGIVK